MGGDEVCVRESYREVDTFSVSPALHFFRVGLSGHVPQQFLQFQHVGFLAEAGKLRVFFVAIATKVKTLKVITDTNKSRR